MKGANDRTVCNWCSDNTSKPLAHIPSLRKSLLIKYINTEQAEQILKPLPPGSVLLRGHCYGQYYLSIVESSSNIQHIPIVLLGSHYFCMGMRYSSLSEIVRFFSCGGDEFGGFSGLDFLNASVLEDMGNIERFVSLQDQEQATDDQLPLWSGDIVSKIREVQDEVVYARNERTGQMGRVHSSSLCPVIDQDKNSVLPYFHPFLLPAALNILQSGGKGAFLIKPSSTQEISSLVLVANVGNNNIQQFLIKAESCGFVLCGRRFPSIGHIIDRYCSMPLLRGVTLSRAVLYSGNYLSLSTSSSCSFSAMLSISSNWQNIASVDIFWKHIRSSVWEKGNLTLWRISNSTELVIEVKTSRNALFKASDSFIYPIDDIVFGRYTCAFIKNSTMGLFLSFKNVVDFLFCICSFRTSIIRPTPLSIEYVSLLSLSFNKLRSCKMKRSRSYSAQCIIDDVKICTTPTISPIFGSKSYSSVVFDQFFLIPLMPLFKKIELSVLSHAQQYKEGQSFKSLILQEPFDVQEELDPNEGLDYQLSIRRIPVLESCCYESFTDWILNCPMPILVQVSDLMTSQEKNFFCVCVTSHFLFRKKMLYQILRRLITYSLETSSFDNILRQDSLTTTFLSQMLQVLCRTEFIELIREELRNCSTEVIEDETHINLIIKCLNSMVSQNEILRNILVVICQTTNEIYPDSILLSRKIISVILVLRFACPLLLKDNSFPPNVVKQVQMIANKSLSSSDNDNGTVLSIRDLFDGIAKLRFKEETSELYTFPWHGSAALACYMLNTCISRKLDLMATLPDLFKQLLERHSPSS